MTRDELAGSADTATASTASTASPARRPTQLSPVSVAAREFVEARLPEAKRLGKDLAELLDNPDALATALRAGLERLADPAYRDGQLFIAPGLRADDTIGVRLPLIRAVTSGLRRASRWAGPDRLLWVGERLLHDAPLEVRMIAFDLLTQVLPSDPERAWQVLRGAARRAGEWITVDSLAQAYGAGILLEERRWAEIEILEYSPSRWERRLVGSTIATIPFVKRGQGRDPGIARHALPILGDLIGDAEPDVQKALSWALRSQVHADLDAVTAFVDAESAIASETGDGHRAWVLRDALQALRPEDAARIRARLEGIRRRPGAPSTSRAAITAERFRRGPGNPGNPESAAPVTARRVI